MSEKTKNRGMIVIQWVAGIASGLALLIAGQLYGQSARATDKADKALEQVGAVSGDIKEIKSDLRWLRESFAERQAVIKTASSTQ